MMTVLAYIIVIVLSQFCLTAGAMVAALLSLILFWLPDRGRATLCALLGGVSGSVLAVGLAYAIFKWLVGPETFGIGPFLAAVLPLSIPIYNDYKKSRELAGIQSEAPASVAAFTSPTTAASKAMVFGELAGIVVAAVLFL